MTGRVLIFGRETLLMECLGELLQSCAGFSVVGVAHTAKSAHQVVRQEHPDVIVAGIQAEDSLSDLVALHELAPDTRLVVLADSGDPVRITAAIEAGADAYLLTIVSRDVFISALRTVLQHPGQLVLLLSQTPLALSPAPLRTADGSPLTGREVEVVTLVGEALTNAQIASRLSISEGTVKRHLHNIFSKLNAVSRLDALRRAQGGGLIPQNFSASL